MIPYSKNLWRNVLIMLGVLFLNIISISLFFILHNHNELKAPVLINFIMYSIFTLIFTLITLGVVFKKAMNGTFGYDEEQLLVKKSRICEFLII